MARWILALAVSCFSVGCAPPPSDPSAEPENTSASTPEAEEVQLAIRDWETTRKLVDDLPGQVVVMDIWATYCPPCVEEFPNLVKLQKSHPDEVTCISVSADYEGIEGKPVESYRDKVLTFLKEQDATIHNVLLSTDAETLFSGKLDHYSMPVVYVFDQQGKLAGQFPDPEDPAEFTYQEHVVPLVEKLLAAQ